MCPLGSRIHQGRACSELVGEPQLVDGVIHRIDPAVVPGRRGDRPHVMLDDGLDDGDLTCAGVRVTNVSRKELTVLPRTR